MRQGLKGAAGKLSESIKFEYTVPPDDFTRAGEASSAVKRELKMLGFSPEVIRKVAIAMYEGEINMVIHANGGKIIVEVRPDCIDMTLADTGPGIADIELAMREGYSTAPENVRNLGFGAGMGLSNMKKYSDYMKIESELNKGTTVYMKVFARARHN
ncbi:MAG TPA: anti-sigma regulatory factor [Ruminococcaceae bacterium]|nr:anti-sigma regulatory factor [Oscillospiraceae bacterium]